MKEDLKKVLELASIVFDGLDLLEKILDTDDDPNATVEAVKATVLALRRGLLGAASPQVTRKAIDDQIDDLHTKQNAMRAASDAALKEQFR